MSPQKSDILKHTTAIVLCAGEGTRIKELSSDIPKPLIKVKPQNSPILEIVLNSLIQSGLERIIIARGYEGEKIEEFVDNYINKYNLKANHVKSIYAKLYKMGPLFTLLSCLSTESIQEDEILIIFPGDTIFEVELLKEIFSEFAVALSQSPDKPIVLYREQSAKYLRQRYRNSLNYIPVSISIVEIDQVKSSHTLKAIRKRDLTIFHEDDLIKQLIPIFLFNSAFLHVINNFPNIEFFHTIWEIINYSLTENITINAINIMSKEEFYDIDSKYDLIYYKEKKEQ
ncbi:MAG: NTP transferase domain-containing protein [Promethearchaeota archaeon]